MRPSAAALAALLPLALALPGASAQRPARATPPAPVAGIDRPLGLRTDLALRVAGEPDWIAIHRGDVWATVPAPSADSAVRGVVRIDGRTGREVARIALDRACGPIASGLGAVWVHTCGADASIVRIDPARNRVSRMLPVGMADSEGAFAFAEGALWVATDTAGVLARVDTATGRVLGTTAVARHSYTVVEGGGALWVVSTGGDPVAARRGDERARRTPGLVQRVDPRTGRVVARIPVGPGARFAAFGEGALWVMNALDGTVSRVDPAAGRETARIALGDGASGGDVAVGAGRVWVRTYELLLAEIDPRTNRVVARWREPARAGYGAYGSGAVRVDGRAVWLSAHDVDSIWRMRVR